MANNRKPRPITDLLGRVVDSDGVMTHFFRNVMRDLITRADKITTNLGEIHSEAPVVGRVDGLGTTVGNLDQNGKLISTDAIATDGSGQPLTGGKRAAQALNSNNQLNSSFNNNPLNVNTVPMGATSLSNDGVSTIIFISVTTLQFGPSLKTYASGSVDPGAFGTFFIYADDPTFTGGTVTFHFTSDPTTLTAGDSRLNFGKIITVMGAAKTGGGNTGGTTPGGEGGRGVILS